MSTHEISRETGNLLRYLGEIEVEKLVEERDDQGLLEVESGDGEKRREGRDVSDGSYQSDDRYV